MQYKFKVKGKEVNVFMWGDNFHDSVTVFDGGRNYERTLRKDENGKEFFTWDRQKIYTDSYLAYSLKELKERVEKGEFITSDELTQAILKDGVENARFICPLSKLSMVVPFMGIGLYDGNRDVDTVCKITEERYKVKENYKIGVVPENETIEVGSDSYYTMDMVSLIKGGYIKIMA